MSFFLSFEHFIEQTFDKLSKFARVIDYYSKNQKCKIPVVLIYYVTSNLSPLFLWQSPAQYSQIEKDAIRLAQEISAEYWAVSSLTGE